MELRGRERVRIEREGDRGLSPKANVVSVIVCCSLPPPVIEAVTVMEYSVPSSRPSSVYIVSLPAMGGIMVLESVKQSVSVAE